MLVAVQLFVPGLYLPPVFNKNWLSCPPHTIISLPVHTAVCKYRAEARPLVAVQLSVLGLYLPPVLPAPAPQTIISLPVHTAVCSYRPVGALMVLVAAQLSTHPLGASVIVGSV